MNIKKMESNVLEHPYTPFISILLITALIALFNVPIMATLWRYSFDDGTYSHAYLIPFIVFYLYFTLYENNELQLREKLSWFALVLLVLSGYVLFITSTAQISLAYWLATLILLCGAINFLFKPSIKLFFPALYFIFLIPLWGLLTIPLQSLSVISVNTLMSFTSIPVFVEQQFVHIPSGVFEIAGGCSGLRYLLTSLAISSLYIFLYLRSTKNMIIFVSVAIFGALLTNWLRIAILIVIGHQTEMTSDLMADHNMFGWYIYVPFMLVLFKFGGYLTDAEIAQEQEKTVINTNTISKFNWSLISVLFIVLLLSSTGFKQRYLLSSIKYNEAETPQNLKIKPDIFNYSSLDIVTKNHDDIHLIYYFNGKKLEGKPTFFDNNLIPKGWSTLNKDIINQQQVITIQKGKQRAQLRISYEISGKEIATVGQFKKERIKEALTGQGATSLHWQFKRE
ncbi:MAG: exosortase [Colwellia sp.]|nr:exosortase [Colwellia sp.]